MKHLVLDIETIPDPEFAEEWATAAALTAADPTRRALPSVPHNKIVVIGCFLLDDYVPVRLGILGEGKTEEGMLRALADWISPPSKGSNPWNRGVPGMNFVTWNGRGFDMPCIAARFFRYAIPCGWWYQNKDVRYRYSTVGHHDVMDYLSDFGSTKVSKMDVYAQLSGFPGKFGVDGSKVEGMIRDGELAKVQLYCLTDVVQTAAIFLRAEMIRGMISLDDYREHARKFLDFCDADARVVGTGLMELVNRDRFLAPLPSALETYEAISVT